MSTWRYITPQVGMTGVLHRRADHLKPRNGTEVKITGMHGGGVHAYVETSWGDYLVPIDHIDCGREWQTIRGAWIPESDPRVRRWLEKAIADLRAGGKLICASANPEYRRQQIADLEWVAHRNGWKLPSPSVSDSAPRPRGG